MKPQVGMTCQFFDPYTTALKAAVVVKVWPNDGDSDDRGMVDLIAWTELSMSVSGYPTDGWKGFSWVPRRHGDSPKGWGWQPIPSETTEEGRSREVSQSIDG